MVKTQDHLLCIPLYPTIAYIIIVLLLASANIVALHGPHFPTAPTAHQNSIHHHHRRSLDLGPGDFRGGEAGVQVQNMENMEIEHMINMMNNCINMINMLNMIYQTWPILYHFNSLYT